MDSDLEKRIRDVVDRHEIWQVLQRYGRAIDRNDRELLRSCYFADAIEDHGASVSNVEDFMDHAIASSVQFVEQHHGVMNHYCELDGDDAYAETYWLFTGMAKQSPHFMSMGRYIDHFQRRDGEWRIANRVNIIERNFSVDEAPPTGPRPKSYGDHEEQPIVGRDRSDVSYQRPLRPRPPREMKMRD